MAEINTTEASQTKAKGASANGGAKPASIWRLLPILIIAAGIAAFFLLGGQDYLSFEALKTHRQTLLNWTADHYVLVVMAFLAIYVISVAFSLPGAIWLTIASGFLFGKFLGTGYVIIGATLGATAIFLIARYALRDYFEAKAGNAIKKMEAGFRENALSYMLVLRLVPIFPFFIVNLVPALLGVPLRTYFFATLFGIIPGSFVYNLVGNGLGAVIDTGQQPDLGIIFKPDILSALIGLESLSLIPVFYNRFKGQKG